TGRVGRRRGRHILHDCKYSNIRTFRGSRSATFRGASRPRKDPRLGPSAMDGPRTVGPVWWGEGRRVARTGRAGSPTNGPGRLVPVLQPPDVHLGRLLRAWAATVKARPAHPSSELPRRA